MYVSPKPHSLEGKTANNFHVFAKNARLQTDIKLAELLGELETLEWDALLFSETRTAIGKRILPGGHMLLGSTTVTNFSGVAILLHQRHRNSFSNVQCIPDRLMSIDLQCSGGVVRLVAGYAPHMGYSQDELQTFYDQLFYGLRGLKQHCVGAIVGGDFNTQLCVGLRGQMLKDLLHSFVFEIANGQSEMQNADDTWTFRSSAGIKRRIDFSLYSSHLCCFDGHARNDLDLGSDHRAVYAGFTLAARVRGKRHRKQTKKRWKPLESNDGSPSLYNQVLPSCAVETRRNFVTWRR